MSSNVLRPDLIWIEGRCYRSNEPVTEVTGFQEHDLYESDSVNADEDENIEDGTEVVMLDNSRFSTSFHVPQHYLGSVIGKKGATKIRIEHETKTEIKIPRQGQNGLIAIFGPSASNVKAAKRRINTIVISSRMKQKFTHFLSIQMNNPDIMTNFLKFQESVLRECPARGLDESIFIKAQKLHLTIGILCLMDNEERTIASNLLIDAKAKVVMPILEGHLPLKIMMKGLSYMNDEPNDIHVLYAKVEEYDASSGILQRVADSLVDHFHKEGFMKKGEYGRDYVKLHVTLINTRYRSNSMQDALLTRKRESFDGSEILNKFGDYEFGVMEVNDIHLSQRHAYGPDGFYQSTCLISLK